MDQGFPESIASPGIKESWEVLAGREPQAVQAGALVDYDRQTGTYMVPCLGQTVAVSLGQKRLWAQSDLGNSMLNTYPEYSKLSILRYLAHAQDKPLSGEMIKPSQLPGGDFFASGSHVLPMGALARRFDHLGQELVRRGKVLGGVQDEHGDAGLKLFSFPRIPVQLIFWFSDDEFPAGATLLVDRSCLEHMAVDIVWSTCMLSLLMLRTDL
ncbi:DUF3786 domain-containing protein [Desulfovermiculus halophilus]|jgi:hypothetical protein|uniref:DUF3786 domain-containing protein n=1 Tax=Desulfovermiculus halophilus TaxID=339722 RepID=UPI00048019C5|nr:DUF3786 domain-containing protein [Desulfovermiculus halophilus]